jgi:transketolase N-terminal domain/subunit
MMADIYTMNGEEITMGLQGSAVCDEAIQAAKGIAKDLDEIVRLEDDGEVFDVHPDGTVEEGEKWESDFDEDDDCDA